MKLSSENLRVYISFVKLDPGKKQCVQFLCCEQGSERKQQMAKEYREKVEKELRDICNDVLVSL